MNSTPNGMLQMTGTRIEVETIETEPKSKCKSNKRKWVYGQGAGYVMNGVIASALNN